MASKNLINREPGLTSSRIEYFHIRVIDFQTLGDDIDKLIGQEQLFNKIIYLKIERKWRTRND
jgi:hypothetical protein